MPDLLRAFVIPAQREAVVHAGGLLLRTTFANRATDELYDRLYVHVGRRAQEIRIFTIHAFCQHVLASSVPEEAGHKALDPLSWSVQCRNSSRPASVLAEGKSVMAEGGLLRMAVRRSARSTRETMRLLSYGVSRSPQVARMYLLRALTELRGRHVGHGAAWGRGEPGVRWVWGKPAPPNLLPEGCTS